MTYWRWNIQVLERAKQWLDQGLTKAHTWNLQKHPQSKRRLPVSFFVLKQWDGGVGAEVIIPQTSWQVVLSLRANAGSAPIASWCKHNTYVRPLWSVGCPKKLFCWILQCPLDHSCQNGEYMHHRKFQIYRPINKNPPALFSFTL